MKCILLVEDNQIDQFIVQKMVSSYKPDIELVIASDGEEALEFLKENDLQPDLVLLDINMPRMGGIEFLEVFSEGNTREIPVVVMLTSSDQEADKEQCNHYICVKDYMIKPINKEKLDVLAEMVLS